MKYATLIHLIEGDKTWLAHQEEVIVGLKSYGGKIEDHQTPHTNIRDELFQEAKCIVKIEDIKITVVVDFYNDTVPFENPQDKPSVRMFCGTTTKWEGTPQSTKEMTDPRLYPINNLPFDKMIMGDIYFIPQLLAGKVGKIDIRKLVEKGPGRNIISKEMLNNPVFIECAEEDLPKW